MSGIEEAAIAAWIANAAADSALVYGGLEAGAGTAAAALGTAGTGALTGAGASAAASYGGASMAEQLAMQRALDAGGTAVAQNVGYGGEALANMSVQAPQNMSLLGNLDTINPSSLNMLSDPSSVLAQDATGNQFASQWDMYKNYAQQGLKALGKGVNSLPAGATSALTTGLMGNQQQPAPPPMPQRPPGGGGTPPQNSTSLLGQQQPTQVQPYAPIFGGGPDDAEMRRRKMMMMRGYA
jgi:hypothetical protein